MSTLLPGSFSATLGAVLWLTSWAVSVEVTKAGESPPPVPDILVKFVADTSARDRSEFESEHGLTPIRHFASIDVFHYRSRTSDAAKLVAKLEKSPLVVYAEIDQKHHVLPSGGRANGR